MEKLCTIFVLFFTVNAITMQMANASTIDPEPKAVENWFKNLPKAKEKVTKLHFYFHDIVTAQNPTAITVAQANSTAQSPTLFGLVRIMDNVLTAGPELNSMIVGRGQGLYAGASLEETSLLLAFNLVFTVGKYNGSTLAVLGRQPFFNEYREMPIIGGTGVFRLARGIATVQTVWVNVTTQNGVGEYNVNVIHY